MENAIKFLRIQNFKSIKDVTLHPRRVNLIIGEPNVGKSNLLEAMTLLGGITYEQTEKFMGSFIRYEEPRQLFYDGLLTNTIKVETDQEKALLGWSVFDGLFKSLFISNFTFGEIINDATFTHRGKTVVLGTDEAVLDDFPELIKQTHIHKPGKSRYMYATFDDEASFKIRQYQDRLRIAIKTYYFSKQTALGKHYNFNYLSPPQGNNLLDIIQKLPGLRKEISRMFEHYGQKLQVRMNERRLEIIKDQDGVIYSYPYSSVADTLQRIIFYLAAIESNDDAVLLFEEPEAHSFPVYVSKLGRRIVESRNNQFFIDTHSPYLIDGVLEDMLTDEAQAGELAVFAAYYEDHQTKVHQLSDEEIRSIRNDSIDVFYNMKRFTTGRIDA
ncbi:MAG TPA: AAA family ATPase [Hymenobacter sp.]|jgi:AAA15 family ATPase/GTPase|uniref:AAA family ATPase n=1 Tax=Hymenobacter sp. TaxID=1898978 RepID=UPI002EDB3BE4